MLADTGYSLNSLNNGEVNLMSFPYCNSLRDVLPGNVVHLLVSLHRPMVESNSLRDVLPGNVVHLLVSLHRPMVESKNHRFGMISDQHEVLGKTRAFDGSTLYLPKKVTENSLVLQAVRKTDGANITITVTLVATVQYVQCFQLFNVIFRRVMRALDLAQVGRNYYDPHSPIAMPQHKLVASISLHHPP